MFFCGNVINWRAISSCLALFAATLLAYFSSNEYFSPEENCFTFLTDWYDPVAGNIRKFQLSFYPRDNSAEMYDIQSKKLFLKRLHVEGIDEKDLYLGNIVVILSRQLKITDYANPYTKEEISKRRQRTFAMVKPDAVHKVGEIIELIQSKGFEIIQMKMVHLTQNQAEQFYEEHSGQPFFENLVAYIISGPVIALELIGNEAVINWRKFLGPTDSEVARTDAPGSLRAKFGKDKQQNAAHGSDSFASATRELNFFFSHGNRENPIKATAHLINTTCCVIKPHAVSEGYVGAILTAILQEGFLITGLEMFRLERKQAEEFYEVYKGVVDEYPRMVQQLISGPLVALEISHQDGNASQVFRNFAGPTDPDVAREIRPHSLRARFGYNKVKNGVHCSDLPEDGPLEVEYFFKILQ